MKKAKIMSRKKKLLMTASTFPRWDGDTEPRFILDLAKSVSNRYDVTVLVPAAPGAKEDEVLEGIKVHRYHYLPVHRWESLCYPGAIVPRIKEKKLRVLQVPFLMLALWIQLIKNKRKYHLVHAHWVLPQGIVHSFSGSRYLLTGHGGDIYLMSDGLVKRIKQRAICRAEMMTVVSNDLKKKVIQDFQVPADKIRIIPMGCDISTFSPDATGSNQSGIPLEKPSYLHTFDNHQVDREQIVLYVGRLVKYKGVQFLIEAVKELTVQLFIVGSGPYEEVLKKQAEPLKGRVHFLGARPHAELPALYRMADVCVFPSIKDDDGAQEGRSLTIIEAMACGIPVITCPTGGIGDTLRDGQNGLFAVPGDSHDLAEKIKKVLEDSDFASEIRICGRKTAELYSLEKTGKQYMELYDEMLLARQKEDSDATYKTNYRTGN